MISGTGRNIGSMTKRCRNSCLEQSHTEMLLFAGGDACAPSYEAIIGLSCRLIRSLANIMEIIRVLLVSRQNIAVNVCQRTERIGALSYGALGCSLLIPSMAKAFSTWPGTATPFRAFFICERAVIAAFASAQISSRHELIVRKHRYPVQD